VPAEAFEDTLASLVRDVVALAPLAVQATKQSIDELAVGRMDLQALRERERLTLASEDFAEGRRAFAQRRAPRFNGA
jgi:enoyl-CoA hydratase/carnithine racemase